MKKEKLSDFDKEYQKEKRRKNTIIGACLAAALVFCVLTVYLSLPDNIPKTQKLIGTISSATTVKTKDGDTPALKITLDDGQEITLMVSDGLVFKQDAQIQLKKITSTAGIDSYQFINYVQ